MSTPKPYNYAFGVTKIAFRFVSTPKNWLSGRFYSHLLWAT
ncbi:MAG TPA: hypothetical protein PKH83_06230 [Cyclobacteriaceae bacterium]|nr:hypothetical protein [Cyclobacteriaceae bacterium]